MFGLEDFFPAPCADFESGDGLDGLSELEKLEPLPQTGHAGGDVPVCHFYMIFPQTVVPTAQHSLSELALFSYILEFSSPYHFLVYARFLHR